MRLVFDGDGFRVTGKLRKALESCDRRVLLTISESMADEAIGLAADGFREERDPYGKPWAPKKVPDGRKVLSGPTGRLKKFGRKVVDHGGFRVGPVVDYGVYHQHARPPRKKRMMVPGSRMPRKWSRAFEEASVAVLAAHLQ